ncbi:MAG: TIGR00153 family protein [Nitrospinota bacterium]|nr:TIGR00153 family protein [Nitrospinota bacterium]
MRSILSLFGKSPFKPLILHIDKVKACVDEIQPLFKALREKNYNKVSETSELIARLEHEADKIKDDIRTNLSQSMFLPVDKRDFMSLLSAQDDISDAVEDLAVLLAIRNLTTPEPIQEQLDDLVDQIVKTAYLSCDLIYELDDLLEASFGGVEADKVDKAAGELGSAEWEADRKQFNLAKKLFSLDDILNPAELILWNEVIRKLGVVADNAEQIGKIVRMFLAK